MGADLLQQTGLSLDRLQSFCRVAEAAGVTKAARGDPARQSLFSRQVKELEQFFGTELIRRKGRGIVLTEAGHRLHLIARECFASLADFRKDSQGQPVEIVIGAGETLIQWLLLPRLPDLRKRIPNARLKFLNLTTDEAVKRLADGLIDFALVRKDAVTRPLQATPLGVMRYCLFLPKDLAASSGDRNDLAVLDGLPLATLEGEGSFRAALAGAAQRGDITLNIQLECSSFPLAARAVLQGGIAAILPSLAAADLAAAGVREANLRFLRSLERDICLASNPRLARIRPCLSAATHTLGVACRF